MIQEVFERTEKKYIITAVQKEKLLKMIGRYIKQNKYFFSEIRNIYFDTEDFELIRKSIEKPLYKEKIRVRSYRKTRIK